MVSVCVWRPLAEHSIESSQIKIKPTATLRMNSIKAKTTNAKASGMKKNSDENKFHAEIHERPLVRLLAEEELCRAPLV